MKMNHNRSTFRFSAFIFILFQTFSYGLRGQNLVTYAGNAGKESFNDVYRLPNGKILVAGHSDNLSWTSAPQTNLQINLAPSQFGILSNSSQRAFLLLMNAQSTVIERVFVFPQFTVADVSRIRTTDDPTKKTDDSTFVVYISGKRTVSTPGDDGYFIARLNGNFITGAGGLGMPNGTSWYYPVNCPADEGTSAYKDIQPWDVGGDGQVVYGMGKAYSWDWAAIYKLDATGKQTTVENWPDHWGTVGENAYRKASAYPGGAQYSGIVLKVGRAGSLRSSSTGDSYWNGYNWNLNTDERGNPRVGKFPDDFYFNKAFNGSNGSINTGGRGRLTNPATNSYGDSVKTYRANTNSGDQVKPTARLGGITIDRRNNHIYFGTSTKSSFYTPTKYQGKNWVPDFEPMVMAMSADGQIKWWARLYDQSGISPPDQYIDGVEVDYSNDQLVVLGRQHGNNTFAFWRGNQVVGNSAFQNSYTGVNTVATGHYSWIGKYDLIKNPAQALPLSPVIKHCTYMMEYRDPAQGLGSPSSDPKLDGWPSPNSGFPDLNTTKFPSPGRLAITPGGSVCVIGNGRRVITTSDAFQKMPKQKGDGSKGAKSSWSDFVRIYLPDLSGLIYSSLLTGQWDTISGAGGSNTEIQGLYPYNGGIYVVGSHLASATTGEAQGNSIPTAAVPGWGNSVPQNQSAIFGRLKIDRNYPISVQLNPNIFCTDPTNRTFPIKFTPPAAFLVSFGSGTIFSVELSSANGRFKGQGTGGSTTVIGTLLPAAPVGNLQQTITATFPSGIAGSGYGLRVRALNPLSPGPGYDTIPGYWYNVTLIPASPATPGTISGETLVCGNAVPTSTYSVRKVLNAANYEWEITPTVGNIQDPCNLPGCAGIIGGTDSLAVVVWNPSFSGVATIRVRAKNPCGTSPAWSVLTNIIVAPCITTSFTGSVCAGPNLSANLPFTIPSGVTVSVVNTFTAQLSDQFGSFGSPVNIGSINNIPAGNGPITTQIIGFNIPIGIIPTSTYRIRIIGTGTTPSIQGFPSDNVSIRTPPAKPGKPLGVNQLCYNNIRTGAIDVQQFRSQSGQVLIYSNNHGLESGQKIYLNMQAPAPASFNGVWTVTKINNNDFLLNGSVYSGTNYSDLGQITFNYFSTTPQLDASYYEWSLSNPAIGSFQTNNDAATIINFNKIEANSWLKVRAVNECGTGPWSDSLQLFVESCIKINLEPNSVWCPGSFMNTSSPGGSIKLQISKASFISFSNSSNYKIEISDQTGNFVNPFYSSPIFWSNNQSLTGRVTAATNGPGKILLTIPNHGFSSGANIKLNDFSNGYNFLNNTRDSITVIDANTIRLEKAPLCSSGCNFSPLATVSGHDLLTPVGLSIPLPSTMLPSSFYQLRVSCISNCTNNANSISSPLPFTVGPPPVVPVPTGTASAACNVTRTYSIPAISGATAYTWILVPALAGTITGSGNSISVAFSNAYTGTLALLSVRVTTGCGDVSSIPLKIETNCSFPFDPPLPNPVTGSYKSKTSGAWKSASTWDIFNGSSWTAATSYPGNDGTAGDDPSAAFIYIGGYIPANPATVTNHTVSLDGAISADQIVVRKETFGPTANLTINSNATLTILNGTETNDCQVHGEVKVNQDGNIITTGGLSFLGSSMYRHNYTTSAGTIPTSTWLPNSGCIIEGYTTNTTPPVGLNQLFQNFIWNTPGLQQEFNLKGQLNNVLGKFNNQNNNGKWLALTDNSSPIYMANIENRDRLYLNTGTTVSASNTLSAGDYINYDNDMYGSKNAAAGNLLVASNFIIQKGTVALTASSGSPIWSVKGYASITQDGKLLGNRGGSGASTRMDVFEDFTINNANATLAGSNWSNANFLLNIGGNLLLQNGNINDYNTGGNFTINVAGDYLQTIGSLQESRVNLNLNVGGNFIQSGGTIAGGGARGSMVFGFNGIANQSITLIPASYNGNRVSLLMNKPSGQLIPTQTFVYQNFTWIKGNLNVGSLAFTGSQSLILNGLANVGSIVGTGSLNHKWLKAQGGVLLNPSDLLTINGGTGGAVNSLNTNSYVSDFLKFNLNPKLVSNATFSMDGNWSGDATISLNNHGLQDGDVAIVAGTTNNGGAFNGTYTVSNAATNSFSLKNKYFPGNWNSSNTGTLSRIDNFEIPIGNSTGYQGFGFNNLQNDASSKSFRLAFKSTGPNEATGTNIRQVGQVPGLSGNNWVIQRLSGSGVFESLSSIKLWAPGYTSDTRIGQSNAAPFITGYTSRDGAVNENYLSSTQAIDINSINTTSGSAFAFGNSARVSVVPPGSYQNLTQIAAIYNDATFTGPITFTLPSTYNGTDAGPTKETFPIVFKRKQTFPVVIKVASGGRETSNSSLTSGSNAALVVLNGVTNITFDGQASGGNWKFVNYGTGDSANTFLLVAGASNHVLKNLDIQASSIINSFTGAVLLGTSKGATGNSNNQILNNKIRNNQANRKPLFIKTIKQTLFPGYIDGGIIINAANTVPVLMRTAVKHGYSNGQLLRIRNVDSEHTDYIVSNASNASPIVITTSNHGLITGNRVYVGRNQPLTGKYSANVGGNTAANGSWTVTVTGPNTFQLNGSSGNGAFVINTGDKASWTCLDPTIMDSDYFIKYISDSTLELYKDAALSQGYGGRGRWKQLSGGMCGSNSHLYPIISNISSATPVVITTSANHQMQTGQTIGIEDSLTGNNRSDWIITKLSATTFSLNTSTPASFPAGNKWRMASPPLIAVTSVPHGLNTSNVISIQGIVFPPNANGNFQVGYINDTTVSLKNTFYYHTPFFGPAAINDLTTLGSSNLVFVGNTTPIRLGTPTPNGFNAGDLVTISGNTNGLVSAGNYILWTGQEYGREVFLLNTRRIERPYQGTPSAFFDSGIAKGIVSNNEGTTLSETNTLDHLKNCLTNLPQQKNK